MYEDLKIITYPDPRLRKVSEPVTQFDDNLRALAARMLHLMHEAPGVGLAAPQVGMNIRMFVANATGELADDRVFINPVLEDGQGSEEAEEGCLSLPGIRANMVRARTLRIKAVDLDGKPFEEDASDLLARICQHETDHLDGVMITDRMGPVAKIASRKILRELQDQWDAEHSQTGKSGKPRRI